MVPVILYQVYTVVVYRSEWYIPKSSINSYYYLVHNIAQSGWTWLLSLGVLAKYTYVSRRGEGARARYDTACRTGTEMFCYNNIYHFISERLAVDRGDFPLLLL